MTIPNLTLNNGIEMPALGFGVFQTPSAALGPATGALGDPEIGKACAYR
ncbi:hypothetical protein [Devosia lacusdianchii]|nr:hypothetical protein [Devosia sp. JXJ CY 41]